MKKLFKTLIISAICLSVAVPTFASDLVDELIELMCKEERLGWTQSSLPPFRVIDTTLEPRSDSWTELRMTTSSYFNFGVATSSDGYGFRDNSGTMEVKDSGGSWGVFGSGSGGGNDNAVWTTSTTSLYPTDLGLNVGIGTTSPQEQFTIYNATSTDSKDLFRVSSTTQDAFVIDKSGYVGIGTDSPSTNLNVNGDAIIDNLGLGGIGSISTSFDNVTGRVNWSGGSQLLEQSSPERMLYIPNGDRFEVLNEAGDRFIATFNGQAGMADTDTILNVFDARGASSGTERFRVNANGNVGINTSGPDRRLDVLDATNPQLRLTHTDGSVYAELQASSTGDLLIDASGGDIYTFDNVGIGTTSPQEQFTIYNATSTLSRDLFRVASTTQTAFVIDKSGNVGIGTDSPTNKLAIQTSSNGNQLLLHSLQETNKYVGLQFKVSTNKADVYKKGGIFMERKTAYNDNILHFVLDGTADASNVNLSDSKMAILTSGNVGINTTGPDRKLDVLDATNCQLRATHTDGSVYGEFCVGSSGDLSIQTSGNGVLVNATTSSNVFAVATSTGASESFVVDSSGNVGIGTSTPVQKLHLVSDPGSNSVTMKISASRYAVINLEADMENDGSSDDPVVRLYLDGTRHGAMGIDDSDNDSLKIFSGDGFVNGSGITIEQSGDVGIGATTPQAKLHVSAETGNVSQYITSGNNSLVGLSMGTSFNTTVDWATVGVRADGSLGLSGGGSITSPDMVITNAADVGIGTTTPSYPLDVNGTMRATKYVGATSTATFNFEEPVVGNVQKAKLPQNCTVLKVECWANTTTTYSVYENLQATPLTNGTLVFTPELECTPYAIDKSSGLNGTSTFSNASIAASNYLNLVVESVSTQAASSTGVSIDCRKEN